MYFLYRDRLESAKLEDVNRVAKEFLIGNNRTLGMFLPTEKPSRAEIPATPDLAKMIGDYKGRGAVEAGEKFDVSAANIEARSIRSKLPSGISVVAIPKKTRGGIVNLRYTLRFGDVESLRDTAGISRLLGSMLLRGTEMRDRQQLKDDLNKYRAKMNFSSTAGSLTCTVETKRENLIPVLNLMNEAITKPSFPAEELGTLQQQYVASYEQQLSDPQALAQVTVLQKLRPFKPGDPRYVNSVAENIEHIKAVTPEGMQAFHKEMISGKNGELTVIGDFDPEELTQIIGDGASTLKGTKPYHRLERPAVQIAEGFQKIETPDKANAVYFAGSVLPIRDDHPDYPALLVGNDIFGGSGALASRLGDRVRQKEGLSYGVGSMLQVSAHDQRAELMIYAISNPENTPKAKQAIAEELDRIREDGITEDELKKAIASYVQSQRVSRASDASLARLIEKNTDAGRTMEYVQGLEEKVKSLTVDQVNAAIRKYLDPKQIFVVNAGDFAKLEK